MKKIILLLLVALSCNVRSQVQVVNDPYNATINTAIQALSEGSNRLSDFMAKAEKLKLATDVLDNLQSIKEIARLMDDLICLTNEFKYYKDLNKNYSCATFLSYSLVSFNLNYTSDILTKVILSKNIFTMPSSDRIRNLETIRRTLEETIKELESINIAIRAAMNKKLIKESIRKKYYSGKGMAYSRYEKRK